jgi:hypothetical protein
MHSFIHNCRILQTLLLRHKTQICPMCPEQRVQNSTARRGKKHHKPISLQFLRVRINYMPLDNMSCKSRSFSNTNKTTIIRCSFFAPDRPGDATHFCREQLNSPTIYLHATSLTHTPTLPTTTGGIWENVRLISSDTQSKTGWAWSVIISSLPFATFYQIKHLSIAIKNLV